MNPTDSPQGIETARSRTIVPAGRSWSGLVEAGARIRIVDLEGEQAVDTLFYNAVDAAERYSAHDTVLAQGHPHIGVGTKILSNEGRVMLTVVADTFRLHDTLVGACSCESNAVRFGEETRQMHACRDNFLIELSKHGLDKRDIVSNLNFFMKVEIGEDGGIAIVDGVAEPGHFVELRAEMDVLCVLSNCPQVNNPANGFDPTPIEVAIFA